MTAIAPASADVAAAPGGAAARPSLTGMSREELGAALVAIGVPGAQVRMRTAQLWHWLYVRGATDFAEMTNVSKGLRADLAQAYSVSRPEIVTEQVSEDGTRKWLLRFPPRGAGRPVEVETVYIPEEGRGTLCLSSQVGCTLSCSFCHTGTQKLVRNLTAEEIVGQILLARDRLGDYPAPGVSKSAPAPEREASTEAPSTGRLVSNIVMMGMGEPLYNFDNVSQALAIAADGDGIALSKRRITLSTSGVVPMISRAGEEIGVLLAISLHAVTDELRDVLVPLNRKYPIAELIAAARAYPGLSNARRITFEYVMLKGINDSPAEARALVRLLSGIPAKINLIPFNPWPGSGYECSDWETIERFADIVNRAGYASPVRTPRGRDILAACGQLKSESERLRIRERMALEAMIAG
jgi:23S rRNA (adenine2503-C2)-methyltransferase